MHFDDYGCRLETLSPRALNRATLQRQHLIAPTDMTPASMIEHLVGMQAQNPLDPYFGLWARLDGFDSATLAAMVTDRKVVRGSFMRGTIHLFTAEDAMAVHPVTRTVLERLFRSTPFFKDVAGVDLDAVLGTARSLLDEGPMTRARLAQELGEVFPDYPPASLAQAATYLTPVVQIPPRGVWGSTAAATWIPIDNFLGKSYGEDAMTLDEMVLRYLGAFGPAAVKDMRVWSGLAGLKEVFDRLRPGLRVYRDKSGAELFDLPDIDLPDPETPVPPRLLPEYDNVLLGHSDRSRFFTGDLLPAGWEGNVLVDGVFAGGWKREESVLRVRLSEPHRRDEKAVVDEADRLIARAWPDEVVEIRVSWI